MEAITDNSNVDELLRAQAHMYRQVMGVTGTVTIKCAIELGILEAVHSHGQPITVSDLVPKLTPAVPPHKAHFLPRVMRVLTQMGYFQAHAPGPNKDDPAYSLTSLSAIFLRDSPTSLRGTLLAALDPASISVGRSMSRWLQSEGTGTAHEFEHGRSFYEQMAGVDPEMAAMFAETMAGDSRLVARALVVKCREAFSGLGRLVDVGGGNGTCAFVIAEAFPGLKVTVFDLPHVVAAVPASPHVDAIGGSMFDYIPKADAIFLKWILHNWTDEDCIKILRKCREAIPEKGGKVMLVEIVLDSKGQDSAGIETQLFMDMVMLLQLNGKERDEREWEKLFLEAGFSRYKISPIGLVSLIEVMV